MLDKFRDSVQHYRAYVHWKWYRFPAAMWRAFAYEVLDWPDGLRRKTWERQTRELRVAMANAAKWDRDFFKRHTEDSAHYDKLLMEHLQDGKPHGLKKLYQKTNHTYDEVLVRTYLDGEELKYDGTS